MADDQTTALTRAARLVAALQARWGAAVIETHISWVLLDGQRAWKIKKPVRLPFLDATDLAVRRHWCEEELRLNSRLAPGLYLDVVPIGGTPAEPCVGGSGPVIEYALRMRQFAPGALLVERLRAGQLQPIELDQLACRLAAFHRHAAVAAAETPYGEPVVIERAAMQALENLARLTSDPACDRLRVWLHEQAAALRPLWAQRKAQGKVVEGHGDLHLANTVWLDGEITAFDCIEFDPALRWIDVQNDIAFTMMDLLAHRREGWAWRFLSAYLDDSGDHAGVPTLRFYLVYRALVRALVGRMQEQGGGAAAAGPDYWGLARRLIEPPDPRLLITHGVSGSGKSRWAAGLIEQAQAVRLRSDVERKRLAGLPADADSFALVPGGIYQPDMTRRTYAHLRQQAELALRSGWRVIVDAAFLRRHERDEFRALARELGVPFAVLHCHAPPAVLTERVQARRARGDDPSEADVAVLRRQLAEGESLQADEWPDVLDANTSEPNEAGRLEQLAAKWLAAPRPDAHSDRSK
ncbi:AAA family ATPase [Aquabacterium sp.]|uniref:bifunctional aminoglycoside phosphotransferase/ATP-binding protein n=1 Tax=Aquabacterium sp. TaxID=1872578 RepID=UPI0035AE2CCC